MSTFRRHAPHSTRGAARMMALGTLLATGAVRSAAAQQPSCNQPAADAVTQFTLPGAPFEPVATADGCWIFVTLAGGSGQIAVLHREGGALSLVRTVGVEGNPTGATLTHDGKLLIVASGGYAAFLDVARLMSGSGDPVLGYAGDGSPLGLIYANVSNDDKLLFMAAERAEAVAVFDLAHAAAIGYKNPQPFLAIHTGNAPIAVTTSPDGRYLYLTSQAAPSEWNWPVACRPEGNPSARPNHAKGAIFVVDLTHLGDDSAHAVVAHAAAGCNPVRLVLSPAGDVAYVTARGDDALLAFDTEKLIADPAHAAVGSVEVGTAPVGIAVVDSGRKVVVTNSNRFAGGADDRQVLTIIDAAKIGAPGSGAVLGTIPAGGFPRELRVTADGRTLLVTNFSSKTLELVDLARLPLGRRN